MNKRQWSAVSGLAVGALVATGLAAPMQAQATPQAASVVSSDPAEAHASRPDNLPNPLAETAADQRKDAIDKLVQGKATTKEINGRRVIEVKSATKGAPPKYVDYPVNREESIFTILSNFSDMKQNEIPQPDRTWDGDATDDNTTYWTSDFGRQHFMDLMFGDGESFKDFYDKQSNGRFLAKGDVSEWVTVPGEAAYYGDNDNEVQGYWDYIRHTAQAWYDAEVAAGKTDEQIKSYLAQFDVWDRYDHDGDGDFNEPDGYIDHFQAVHAGEGEEAGGGVLGDDAIWSHRWYVNYPAIGKEGPSFNKLGGVPLGDSGIWIGDYTTEPENGGLGVFAHEFAHDLGLPDLYDTSGGDNSTAFWTLMSGGSWLNWGKESIGTTPNYMGPWEKLQLGWLDYTVVPFGQDDVVTLSPADKGSARGQQAAIVTLPKKTVLTTYNKPHSGSAEWWGGSADDLNNTLTRTVDLTGKTAASMSAWLEYEIEEDYDYLYVEASTDGSNWTQLDQIDGASAWTQTSWNLDAFAGKQVQLRFRYQTDGGLHYKGAFIDDVTVTADGATVLTDDVEAGTNGWTAKGFSIIDGTTNKQVSHYYIAENRTYSGYDATLKSGPYNFGHLNTKPNWVERFPYQNGMLVWYSDGAYSNNNTRLHPGGGQALPVDARPAPIMLDNGNGGTVRLGNRRQPFDATFGLEATDAVTFHYNGVPTSVPSSKAIPTFDDSDPNRYWTSANPWASTKVAGSGTTMTVLGSESGGNELEVKVDFK